MFGSISIYPLFLDNQTKLGDYYHRKHNFLYEEYEIGQLLPADEKVHRNELNALAYVLIKGKIIAGCLLRSNNFFFSFFLNREFSGIYRIYLNESAEYGQWGRVNAGAWNRFSDESVVRSNRRRVYQKLSVRISTIAEFLCIGRLVRVLQSTPVNFRMIDQVPKAFSSAV